MNYKVFITLVLALLVVPAVLAAFPYPWSSNYYSSYPGTSYGYYPGTGIYTAFGAVGQQIFGILTNTYAVYAVTFVLFFILLYSIFCVGIARVKAFSSDGKISRQGKMAAIAFAALGDMGIFYYTWSSYDAVQRILGTMGWFGSLAFAGMIFAITYYNMKTNTEGKVHAGPAWFAAGLALMMYGMFTNSPGALTWGTVILIVAAIWAGIKSFGGGAGRGENQRLRDLTDRGPGGQGAGGGGQQHGPSPQQVQNFQGVMQGPPNNRVDLSWNGNPAGDNVVAYQIQRRLAGRTTGHWYRNAPTAIYRDIFTGWSNVSKNVAGVTFADGPVNTAVNYEYRIRARSNTGVNGPWSNIIFVPSSQLPQAGQGRIRGHVVFHDGRQPVPRDLTNINITVLGHTTPVNNQGRFDIGNLGAAVAYNIVITDPTNTYSPRPIQNVPPGMDINFGDIVLNPRPRAIAQLIVVVQNAAGAPYNPPITIAALGSLGALQVFNVPAVSPMYLGGGRYSLPVRAGFFYSAWATDPATGTDSGHDRNNGVLLRLPQGQIPNPLQIVVPGGPAMVNGIVQSSVPPNAHVGNSAAVTIGTIAPVRTNLAGQYATGPLNIGPQRVQVHNLFGLFQDFDTAPNPGIVAIAGPNPLPIFVNPRVRVPGYVNAIITGPGVPAYNLIFP